jgi:hypothetical protein
MKTQFRKNFSLKHLSVIAIGCSAITGTASAQILYQDNFSGTGALTGASPTIDTNSNVWGAGDSAGGWSAGSGVATANSFYGGEFLPVNGSGTILNGLSDFTLSADVTTASGGNGIGIVLGSSNHDTGGYYTGGDSASFLAQLGLGGSSVLTSSGNTAFASVSTGGANTGSLTLSYTNLTPLTGSIAFMYNGVTENTLAVTTAQIAALTTVGLGQGAFAGGAEDNFTLTVAPEPSSWALLLSGVATLAVLARRKRNA